MNKSIENKLLYLQNLYSKNKDMYDEKFQIYWKEHFKRWNKKHTATNRIYRSIPTILSVVKELNFKKDAVILDICCGSPVALNKIKNEFPQYKAYGIDIYTNEFEDFEENCSNGVKVFKFPFQMLFDKMYKSQKDIDLVIMTNSFRAFDEKLKEQIKNWCHNNSKNFRHDQQTFEKPTYEDLLNVIRVTNPHPDHPDGELVP